MTWSLPSNTTSSYEPHLSSVSRWKTSACSSSPTSLGASLSAEGWSRWAGLERQLTVVGHRTRLLLLLGEGLFLMITAFPLSITAVPLSSVFGEIKLWQLGRNPWVFKSKLSAASCALCGFVISFLLSVAVLPNVCLTTDGAYRRTQTDLINDAHLLLLSRLMLVFKVF